MKTNFTASGTLAGIIALAIASSAKSQVAYNGSALNYSQNFDSLGAATVSWTDNSTLTGWYLNGSVLGIPAIVGSSTGNNSGGNVFNVGVAGVNSVNDRALGWLNASTTGIGYVGVQLQNTSGQDYIGDVSISLTYEQWSARNTASDPLEVDYKANLVSTGNQLTSTGWTLLQNIASPNLSNSGGGTTHFLDGNALGNFVNVTETITFTGASPWLAGNYLWIRTKDGDISGNDDLNAIDNVVITVAAQPVPEPAPAALAGAGLALTFLLIRHRR